MPEDAAPERAEHPNVARYRATRTGSQATGPLAAAFLRELLLECGADDCGFVAAAVADGGAKIEGDIGLVKAIRACFPVYRVPTPKRAAK